MKSLNRQVLSGQALINDYLTVLTSIATVESARYQADYSENSALDYLNSLSGGRFLDPTNIPEATQTNITRASLDAHIKKAQAQQIESASAAQVAAILEYDQASYRGKKVKIDILDKGEKPVENLWFDNRSGYRKSPYNRNSITGYIEDVYLDKNVLILVPRRTSRLVTPNLKKILVYIINPNSLHQMVGITML